MKLKTHKSLAKRIKITKTGRLRRRHAFRSHLLAKKSSKRKRQFSGELDFGPGDEKKLRKLLPYVKKA